MERDDFQSSPLTRRDFLKQGSAGLAGAALLGTASSACSPSEGSGATELVFTYGPDDSGTLQQLLDAFNREHAGDIQVTWREMPRSSDEYFQQLQSAFQAGNSDIDVIGADVVWTAEFAHQGWVADLSQRFHATYNPDSFLPAALGAASYRFRIWGVPWFSDVGMLYYRRDLLQNNGFTQPPATWAELRRMAQRIQQAEDIRYGFVFQGDTYEGGVANACEYIWSAGGRILTSPVQVVTSPEGGFLTPDVVNVDTPEAARGFRIARSMITEGVTPEEVANFRERDAWQAFLGGEAVFMRNWPFVYGLVDNPELTQLTPEQIGVAAIPAADEGRRSYSCLGGWNLMISAATTGPRREAAWTFIQYLADAPQQKDRAIGGGFLPTLQALYRDPEVEGAIPVIYLGRQAIQSARSRPASPYYSEMSPRIAQAFTGALQGAFTSAQAAQRLEQDLQDIIRTHQAPADAATPA